MSHYCKYKLAAKTMSLFIKVDATCILLYKDVSPITLAAFLTSLHVSSNLWIQRTIIPMHKTHLNEHLPILHTNWGLPTCIIILTFRNICESNNIYKFLLKVNYCWTQSEQIVKIYLLSHEPIHIQLQPIQIAILSMNPPPKYQGHIPFPRWLFAWPPQWWLVSPIHNTLPHQLAS